ncbi:hypothetical protein [Bradyrhizobium mercantei]|uniref:hypothetical protein n=1 Tax=Bradyrhizobium mercantei TaxID=1904807 RepID=UPI0009773000|nr:hypothetical protein [Bradyrhizobium mercantei]
MTNLKLFSTGLIALAMLATPAMAREGHHTYRRHAVETGVSAPQAPVVADDHACIPAPRVGAFATAPWIGDNVPCEPYSGTLY